jgi:hypothetical protein
LFTLGSFMSITERAQISGLLLSMVKGIHKFWQEVCLAAFLVIFYKLIWSPWPSNLRRRRQYDYIRNIVDHSARANFFSH